MSDTRWCPTCGAEYVATMTVCADDGTTLVLEQPQPEPESEPPVNLRDDENAVEFDLTEWDEEARTNLEWMLRGAGVTFEWLEEGVLIVPGPQADGVDGFLDYLAAGPPEETDETSEEWRMTGAATGRGSNALSLDDFYEGDPEREDSEESTFGKEWVDADGVECEVDWIHDTGELYLMKAPKWMPFMVEILDIIETKAEVEQLMWGWETAMGQSNSVQWVRDRVDARRAAAARADAEAAESADAESTPDPEPEVAT